MTKLQQIEKLTGGKATLTQQPANSFFPAPHWFLQTADGGRFGATSKRDLLASILEFLTEQAAEQSLHQTALPRDVEAHDRAIEVELLCESC